MRALVTAAAVVMLASTVQIDRVSLSPLQAQDRVAGILAETRKALGGEDKISAMKGLTAEGPFRRSMGGREMEGTLALTIVRPDKMRRVEDISMGGMVGGPSIERTSVLNGNTAWDDTANRGGMGGGMRIMVRGGPGDGGPGRGPGLTPEQLNEAQVRRMTVQMQRYLAALVADGPETWVDAGIAEAPEGKADILEAKDGTGRTLRLFIDQATHRPLMVQYQDPKPMVMMGGPGGRGGRGPGGPGGAGAPGARGGGGGQDGRPQMTPEEMEKRMEEMRNRPVQMGNYAMHLADYKTVDGILLPHQIDLSVDGEASEEWTVEKYKVNPNVKADVWEKK